MKDYEARARKFIKSTLGILFEGCVDFSDFENAIISYNDAHKRQLKYEHGVSRIAILRNDYVVKVDYQPEGRWANGRAGNCETEEMVYEKAVMDGMEHLLAKTTVVYENDLTFAIMPRIKGVGRFYWHWWEHCSPIEEEWLRENINDLHCCNVGYKNGRVCVIDYAWEL